VPKRAFDAAQLERIRQWLSAGVQDRPAQWGWRRVVVYIVVCLVALKWFTE